MPDSDQTPQPRVSPPPPIVGSMVAGLEFPPRLYPPDPQHLDMPRTYDPRVSVQLERTARDLASGKPGTAALEDLERFPNGAPSPLDADEGAPERETVVTFSTQFASYYAGESAAFTVDEAARLTELGVVGEGGGAVAPPVNTAVPAVTQTADVLSCTMGTWTGSPTSYAYQWKVDGTDVGTDAPSYTALPADVGSTATCVVTATNANGSTAAPPSVGVIVA